VINSRILLRCFDVVVEKVIRMADKVTIAMGVREVTETTHRGGKYC